MPVRGHLFRRVVGSFPSGVTVVTAMQEDGTPRGLTSNAVTAVSAEPPLLLVCIDQHSNTLSAVRHSRAFVVNFLAAGAEELAIRFSSKDPDKFEGLRWTASSLAVGAPILEDHVVAHAECIVNRRVRAGDHWVFIAQIEHGVVYRGTPLMFFRRHFAPWPQRSEDVAGSDDRGMTVVVEPEQLTPR